MTAEAIVAPTDAQLGYIRDLCARNGFPRPECVHSSREASEIITVENADRLHWHGRIEQESGVTLSVNSNHGPRPVFEAILAVLKGLVDSAD